MKRWTDNKVIDFVNWFLDLHRLPSRYKLENQSIIDSFKNGDDYKLWHKNIIERDSKMILNETRNLLIELHSKLDSVGTDFDWDEFIGISLECQKLQEELKNITNT
jgi:hypothetical protein